MKQTANETDVPFHRAVLLKRELDEDGSSEIKPAGPYDVCDFFINVTVI